MSNAHQQQQFLTVISRDEAEHRFRSSIDSTPLEAEAVPLAVAHRRVLAEDQFAQLDIPGFDRSNVDGYAVRAEDTFNATETDPVRFRLHATALQAGQRSAVELAAGETVLVATGGMIPRGATAVVMIEHTEAVDRVLWIQRPIAPGGNITWTGNDISRGELVLPHGTVLRARETAVLAALGVSWVSVVRQPVVGVISTGAELQTLGELLQLGQVYDSNQTALADSARELGAVPRCFGIVPDDAMALTQVLQQAIAECDVVLLSGGTSKGEGDLSYQVVEAFGPPGIVVHGVALKPGKPLCLAVAAPPALGRRPVPIAVLPGFPTSALFTFHEFIAPIIRQLAGLPTAAATETEAILPQRLNSEMGRTEYVLVGLCEGRAIPLGKGSGSVTALGRADGFITIPAQQDYLEADSQVSVRLLSQSEPADLVVVGSHCVALDRLLALVRQQGWRVKFMAVGSSAGLDALKRGECDLAPIHLLHAESNCYNLPYLNAELELLHGYTRMQGIVHRSDDVRFQGKSVTEVLKLVQSDDALLLLNRNRGSGTRVLLDQWLGGMKPPGYLSEATTHSAVAAAIAQGRADWGMAIAPAAAALGLGFVPLRAEQYDFAYPKARAAKPVLAHFRELLQSSTFQAVLQQCGFTPASADAPKPNLAPMPGNSAGS